MRIEQAPVHLRAADLNLQLSDDVTELEGERGVKQAGHAPL